MVESVVIELEEENMARACTEQKMENFSEMRGITNRAYVLMRHIPENVTSILDIGCGLGDWGYLFKTRIPYKIRLIGIDVYQPYLDVVSQFSIYDELICADIKTVNLRDQYDVGIMIDVIEHIDKPEAIEVLNKLKLNCKRLIVSLPRGFMPHEAIDGNEFQAHVSGWNIKDFEQIGFDVFTVNRGIRLSKFPAELFKWFVGKRSSHIVAIWDEKSTPEYRHISNK